MDLLQFGKLCFNFLRIKFLSVGMMLFSMHCVAYDFPVPRGEFAVGTVIYHWHDVSRQEAYVQDPLVRRELLVQCWYPGEKLVSKNSGAEAVRAKELYLQSVLPHLAKMIRGWYGVPEFFLNNVFGDVYVHAQQKLPIAAKKKKYPVIIFSHGLGSLSAAHTVYAENLASNGYIVFGINHSYDCLVTTFPDGRAYGLNFKWNQAQQIDYLERVIDTWAQDVRFVIDMLPVLNAQDQYHILTGRIDSSRLGVFGHSMGGGTMTKVCSLDKRVLAGVNLDGPVFDKHLHEGFKTPFMFMFADGTLAKASSPMDKKMLKQRNMNDAEDVMLRRAFKENNLELYNRLKQRGSKAYFLVFKNSGHYKFTDAPLVKYMSMLFQWVDYMGFDIGSIEPQIALRVSGAYLLSFFNTYVCDNKEDSLFEPRCFIHPEVQLAC